jgi:hypothetical protein
MQLWQVDIVGGVMILDPVSGVLREAKVITASMTTAGFV